MSTWWQHVCTWRLFLIVIYPGGGPGAPGVSGSTPEPRGWKFKTGVASSQSVFWRLLCTWTHVLDGFIGWLLQFGRRLVPRSEPPQPKKAHDEIAEQATREEEELAYYFMPWPQLDIFVLTLFCLSTDKMLSTVIQLVLPCYWPMFCYNCLFQIYMRLKLENRNENSYRNS